MLQNLVMFVSLQSLAAINIFEPKNFHAVPWADNARDIINILAHYIPSVAQVASDPLPVMLPRLSHEESEERYQTGFRSRKIIGVGHSLGGCSL